MEETLRLKFNQHPDLRAELLNTGDADLVEVCPIPIIINTTTQGLSH
jgi:predicted NAD-dependent protein-ADP-ribosyltransferase YbiA (DUF1768 family)